MPRDFGRCTIGLEGPLIGRSCLRFFIKALLVQAGHCRVMGYRTGDDIGPGRNGRRPVAPIPF